MNSTANKLIVVGLLCLLLAGYLYNRSDSRYIYVVYVGIAISVCGVVKKCGKNHHKEFDEAFDHLQLSISNLQASLPSSSLTCVDGADGAIQPQINTALTSIKANRDTLIGSYGQITASDPWSAIPPDQQKTITDKYNVAITAANSIITSSTNVSVNGRTIQNWKGIYSCADMCSANGTLTNGNTVDRAQYSQGGTCSCPTGYFPQLDSNNFVKCYIYNTSSVDTFKNSIDALDNLNKQTFNNASSFNLRCNGNVCPTAAPLAIEQTPGPTTKAATPAPTTPAPTTPAPTTPFPTTPFPTTPAPTTPFPTTPAPTTKAATPAPTISGMKSGIYTLSAAPTSIGMNTFTSTAAYGSLPVSQLLADIKTNAGRTDNPLFFGAFATSIPMKTGGVVTTWTIAYSYTNPLSYYTTTQNTTTTLVTGTGSPPLLYTGISTNMYFYIPPYGF